MLLRQTLTSAIARLTDAQVPSPRMNAELLLMFTLGCDRAFLYAHPERELTSEDLVRYEQALRERARGVPAQYITAHQEFWGMDFIVSPAVLIPRPETEHVIEAVLDRVGRTPVSADLHIVDLHAVDLHAVDLQIADLRIIDVGTGSGCIAIALAKELPDAQVHATDISSEALEIAAANSARHRLEKKIEFHHADLLEGFDPGSFDVVVSNPPYVGESEEDQVQIEVRKFEPRNAVFAGPTGLEVIERLIPQAHMVLKPGGWLIMEISGTIAKEVQQLLNEEWTDVTILNDLAGIPRVVSASKPGGTLRGKP